MGILGRFSRKGPPPPPPIDREELRFEMAQTDPEYTRVRDVHHDALNALGARSAADGLSIRREREFWSRQHHGKPNGGRIS
jgi:hypothetical protein